MSGKSARSLGTTPFPNLLLDELMPSLKDTEWRLVCVVVRQTLGWHDGKTGGRKESDWLTQRQLVRRTGRSSEAISRAIDALVRRRLLEVRGTGITLETPAQRRQARGRIDYRLHPRLLSMPKTREPLEGELEERPHELSYSLSGRHGRKSEYRAPAKANGTKENTKETDTMAEPFHPAMPHPCHPTPASAAPPAVSEVLSAFRSRHSANGHGTLGELEGTTVDRLSELVARYDSAELIALMDRFFQGEIKAIRGRGFSLEAFANCIHILRLRRRG